MSFKYRGDKKNVTNKKPKKKKQIIVCAFWDHHKNLIIIKKIKKKSVCCMNLIALNLLCATANVIMIINNLAHWRYLINKPLV